MKRFMARSDRGLYRSRNGAIAGVCRGLAEYYDFSVFWLRVIVVFLLFFSGFWPVLFVYFVASLVIKPEPVRPIHTEDEQDFYDNYVRSRSSAARRLKRRYQDLERRLQRMEDTVTGREFEWDQKMNG
jgi:phage shock protein C